jgi:hypothetical protein
MLTDEQKSLVDECIYLPGRVITSYGQVEFILADISVILDLKFPYLISKRIKVAKEIADRPGYEAYKDGTQCLRWPIEFLRYERIGEGQFQLMRGDTNIDRLRQVTCGLSRGYFRICSASARGRPTGAPWPGATPISLQCSIEAEKVRRYDRTAIALDFHNRH